MKPPPSSSREPREGPAPEVLIFNLGYLTAVPSGGDRHLLALSRAWAGEGRGTIVLPSFVVSGADPGGRVVAVPGRPPRGLLHLLWEYLRRTLRALALARRLPADLVLASPGLFDLLPALRHRHRHGSRVGVFLFHVPGPAGPRQGPLRRVLAKIAHGLSLRWMAGCDRIFVGNSRVREELLERGFDPRRIALHPPAVDAEPILAAAPERAVEVLFVGRLVEKKGIFDLLEVARRVETTFGIVGEGEERPRLEREIRQAGLAQRVRVFGGLCDGRVYALLRGSSCLLLPSYEEGYALVIAEALLAGCSVVAYELPHYREVFGDGLSTAPPGDTEALARELAAVLARGGEAPAWDPALRAPSGAQSAASVVAALTPPARAR